MRPSIDQVMLNIASMLSMRACCLKRQVGCVLTDRQGRIVGSGYNGRIAGLPNCRNGHGCPTYCEGMHAEINALLRVRSQPHTCYITCMPCSHCMKALLASGCERIVTLTGELDEEQQRGYDLWKSFGLPLEEVGGART